MNRIRLVCSFAAIWLVSSTLLWGQQSPAGPPPCAAGVDLAVQPRTQLLGASDPVQLKVTLTNRTKNQETIAISPAEFPFAFQLEALRKNGCWHVLNHRALERIPKKKRVMMDASGWMRIKPGDSYTQEVDITDAVHDPLDHSTPREASATEDPSTCDKSPVNLQLREWEHVYRVTFWHEGVNATPIRGSDSGASGCVTPHAAAQFALHSGGYRDWSDSATPTANDASASTSGEEQVGFNIIQDGEIGGFEGFIWPFAVGTAITAIVCAIVFRVRRANRERNS
jgi:hypothetical protein